MFTQNVSCGYSKVNKLFARYPIWCAYGVLGMTCIHNIIIYMYIYNNIYTVCNIAIL